ncbi:MAG TPA: Ig-like domain-containing protein [Gemmatimonadales bacterium]|jgi:alpha-tubulin suppressor-like RCC1 family protein|nr:Ig-like domain-containing protein [Gemmatimonadales bacterium]
MELRTVKRVTSVSRAIIALTLVSAGSWLGGCSDTGPQPILPLPQHVSVSNPLLLVMLGGAQAISGDERVYVALETGTVADDSANVTIRRVGGSSAILTKALGGGFDPVPVAAQIGDSIDILVRDHESGAVVLHVGTRVAMSRPPIVVRTDPHRKKRDVPLNAPIVVVFSEPVDPASLANSSLQLFRGTEVIPGAVALLTSTTSAVKFTPSAPLTPNGDYRFVVTRAVRDRDGDPLPADMTVEFSTGESSTGPPAHVAIPLGNVNCPDVIISCLGLNVDEQFQFVAMVTDSAGDTLYDHVTWSTDDPTGHTITVSPTGLVTAHGAGVHDVIASVEGLTDRRQVRVYGNATSVTVVPATATIQAFDTLWLTAEVRNVDGEIVWSYLHPPLTWSTSAPGVAIVGNCDCGVDMAIVTGLSPGTATISARSGSVQGTAAITITPGQPVASVTVSPATVSLTEEVRLPVQLTATLRDAQGQVLFRRPVTWSSSNAAVAPVSAAGVVTVVAAGSALVSATSEGISDTATITVTTLNIQFVSLTAGDHHACGITTTAAAFCWGQNSVGQLGDGSTTDSRMPVAISGNLSFKGLAAGGAHTCGLDSAGAAYCWGSANQLGNGSTTNSSVPVAVSGGLTFSIIAAGGDNTCALKGTGEAYCWGTGYALSQVGAFTPTAVARGLSVKVIAAGRDHICALTVAGAAYCWGTNTAGQLGDPNTQGGGSFTPVAVVGGLTFRTLAAGSNHTCALTSAGKVYCWGLNDQGQFGDGSNGSASPTPIAGGGGLTFSAIVAGEAHTCGLSSAGAAYCWGLNDGGQLGDGSTTDSAVPVAVSGGLRFVALVAGKQYTCGVSSAGVIHCWGSMNTTTRP